MHPLDAYDRSRQPRLGELLARADQHQRGRHPLDRYGCAVPATDAIVGWIETWPISFASAGGVTHEMSVTFDKGTTGDITFWIMQP
ncbi:hypothetical protein AB5I41_30865 [Sphingomonas sp. MMS24-JH45]